MSARHSSQLTFIQSTELADYLRPDMLWSAAMPRMEVNLHSHSDDKLIQGEEDYIQTFRAPSVNRRRLKPLTTSPRTQS